jgi:hypothetical protein
MLFWYMHWVGLLMFSFSAIFQIYRYYQTIVQLYWDDDMIYELTMARYLETLTLEVGVLEHEPKSVVLGLWSEVDNLNHLATHVPF